MPNPRRLAALGLSVAMVASACVQGDDPSVSLVKLDADIAFGVDLADTATPQNIAPPPVAPEAVDGGFELPPFVAPVLQPRPEFRNPVADRLPPLRPSQPPAEECPKAPPTATARDVVEVNISGPPAEGLYRWQRSGTQTVPGIEQPIEISGFDRRIVRNYNEISDTVFEFQTVQTKLDSPNVIVSTFRVNTNPTQVAPGGAVVIEEPRANEAEGGVALVKVEEFDQSGEAVGSPFEPTTGLLLLPLPVNSGEEYRSVANDPKTGQAIVHDAKVLGRTRIDACGEVVDGWEVEATQVRSDNESTTYKYLVATQYGGLLIQEGQTGTTAEGGEFDLTFTLGQLDPDDPGN